MLELQVEAINTDVGNIESDVEAIEDEVTIISTGQMSQDERILELEVDSDGKSGQVLFVLPQNRAN